MNEKAQYLQGEQVTLQTVSYENGLSTEHAEQHGLDISQGDGGALQVLLRHAWKPVGHIWETSLWVLQRLRVLSCDN